MTTYFQRQVTNLLFVGQHSSIQDATVAKGRLYDAPRKYQLKLSSGDYLADNIKLDNGDSFTVQLPENYTSADRLAVYIKANAVCKIAISSPTHGASLAWLVKGTNGDTDGEHAGFFAWQGDVTTLTISAPTADVQISYFLYKIPDLTLAATYRDGARTIGTV